MSFTCTTTKTTVATRIAAVVEVCPVRAQGTQGHAVHADADTIAMIVAQPMNTIGHGIGREERDEKPATRDQGEKLE